MSSETHSGVITSINATIKHLDDVVSDTMKQLHAFAQTFQVSTVENIE